MIGIDVCLHCTHFLSSQRQLIRIFTDCHLRASFWNCTLSRSHAPVQVTNLKGALTVNLYEFSQTFRETFSAPLTEVCHDVLYEAVSILLLLRQQLQRIDQICAQALRYCMCFEDLGLIDTFTCLYDQKPVWLLEIAKRVGISVHQDRGSYMIIPFLDCDTAGSEQTARRRCGQQARPCMSARDKTNNALLHETPRQISNRLFT